MGCCAWWKARCGRRKEGDRCDGDEENGIPGFFFELSILQSATNGFSDKNRLGRGGFGVVYKGTLANSENIAVKKLLLGSSQGVKEFLNEIKLLVRVQHNNLVTLLGCCVQGGEKILVYDYFPNKSLDHILFDKSRSGILNWENRFRIIQGVARGILYLHEDSQVRIIHRDIKPSNVLLDDQFVPKISDFGMARLFPEEATHLDTYKIAGTYGYMAPEYAMHGYLSEKSDVFSFGVLTLEIVSGRKNYVENLDEAAQDLLLYTWTLSQEGKQLNLVDQNLGYFNEEEVLLCIQIGLLCCQAKIHARPTMFSVVQMLTYDSCILAKPGKPGIHGRLGSRFTDSKSTGMTTEMVNWELKNCCQRDQKAFLITIGIYIFVILLLWRTFLMTPFKLITVFLHEASHAIACKLTCGQVEGIKVHADEGGVTLTRGGIYWIILPAGYLGSSFWGMVFILSSTNLITARIAAACFVIALLIVLIVAKNWTLRGLCIGFIFLLAIVWLLQEKTTIHALRYVILFIGVMNSLFSVYDIYDDLISRRVNSSDAEKFAELCLCPCNGVAWGVIWGLISFAFLCGAMYLGLVILS